MPAGRYLRTEILEWLQGVAFAAPPASVFAHLCTTAPTATVWGTEVGLTGYAPIEISPADWAAIATGANVDTLSNDVALTFGPFTAGAAFVIPPAAGRCRSDAPHAGRRSECVLPTHASRL